MYSLHGSAPRVDPTHETVDNRQPPPDRARSPEPHADVCACPRREERPDPIRSSSRVDSYSLAIVPSAERPASAAARRSHVRRRLHWLVWTPPRSFAASCVAEKAWVQQAEL